MAKAENKKDEAPKIPRSRLYTLSLINAKNDIPFIKANLKAQNKKGVIRWCGYADHDEDKYTQKEVDAFMKRVRKDRDNEAPDKSLEDYIAEKYDEIPEVDKLKEEHTHFYACFQEAKTPSAALKIMLTPLYVLENGIPSTMVELVQDKMTMFEYLTHSDAKSIYMGKHQYSNDIVKIIGHCPKADKMYASTKEAISSILHRVAYDGLSIEEAEEIIGGDDLTAKIQSDLRTKRDFYIKHVRKIPEYRNLTIFWDIGESGTSKSFSTKNELMQKYPSDVYCLDDRKNDLTSGFDKYDYETHLIIDDFKGDIRYTDLLTTIMNPYAQQLHCRGTGNNKFACWTDIHFTSVLLPCEMYQGMVQRESDCEYDSLEQFERRIDYTRVHFVTVNGVYLPNPGLFIQKNKNKLDELGVKFNVLQVDGAIHSRDDLNKLLSTVDNRPDCVKRGFASEEDEEWNKAYKRFKEIKDLYNHVASVNGHYDREMIDCDYTDRTTDELNELISKMEAYLNSIEPSEIEL